MAVTGIDAEKAEAFAGRLLGILNDGMLTLLISVGHRTGLFDTMAELAPATSEEIARAAGLDERYVREWLAGVAVGGLVELEPEPGTYRLPPEHAAFLTRAAGTDNLATFAQFSGLFGAIEEKVVECFRSGGGVPYDDMPAFQHLQSEESSRVFDATLVDVTLPLAPGLVDKLRAGADVLEIGCGMGHASNLIAAAFPSSRVTGVDISEEGIAAAREEAQRLGVENATFVQQDGASIAPGAWDAILACDVIHDLARPRETLRAIHEGLRPGGIFLMIDIRGSSHVHENFEHPLGPALYTASIFHCLTVSLAQGGEGLGTMWGEQKARELLAEAGFDDVTPHAVEGDILNTYYVARKHA
jgi:2-polyprenyl-3-methyl-5-hydroxy-6-metoxy-1,4-benzoquinol methylase